MTITIDDSRAEDILELAAMDAAKARMPDWKPEDYKKVFFETADEDYLYRIGLVAIKKFCYARP